MVSLGNSAEVLKLQLEYERLEAAEQEKGRAFQRTYHKGTPGFCSLRKRWQKRRASCWTRQFLAKLLEFGAYHRLVQELRLRDGDAFKNFFRLPKLLFDSVLSVVGPKIARQDATYRQAIYSAERLAICLR
ncbi:unnamed protein product [Gadus morhua 'NCC']